jgi:hypothetical protein
MDTHVHVAKTCNMYMNDMRQAARTCSKDTQHCFASLNLIYLRFALFLLRFCFVFASFLLRFASFRLVSLPFASFRFVSFSFRI